MWLVDGDQFSGRFGFSVVKTGREKVAGTTTVYPEAGKKGLEKVSGLPESSQRRLLFQNAADLYGFPESALGSPSAV